MLTPTIEHEPPSPALHPVSHTRPIETTIITTRERLVAVRDELIALRAAMASPAPNSDPDRYLTTLDALGDSARAYAAMFRRDGRCVGAVVARTSASRTRHRLGYWSIPGPRLRLLEAVYDGLLTDGSDEACALIESHLQSMIGSNQVDAVHFNHLVAGGPLEAIALRLGAARVVSDPHWIVELERGSVEGSLAHHSGDFRKKLRRYERKASENFGGDLALRLHTEPSSVDGFIAVMDRIASQSYKSHLPVSNAGASVWGPILTSEARLGRMRCYTLVGGGEPVAYQIGSVYGSTYQCEGRGYDSRFRDLSPGTVLFTMVLKDLCTLPIDRMDFGFGDAEHKRTFGTRSWTEASYRLHGRGWRSRTDAWLSRAVSGTSAALRPLLERTGLLKRVKHAARGSLLRRGKSQESGRD